MQICFFDALRDSRDFYTFLSRVLFVLPALPLQPCNLINWFIANISRSVQIWLKFCKLVFQIQKFRVYSSEFTGLFSLLLKYLSFCWIIPIPLFRCFLVSWGSFLWLMPYSRDYLWQLFFQIKMTSSEVLLHSFRCLRYWFYVFYWYYGLSFIS